MDHRTPQPPLTSSTATKLPQPAKNHVVLILTVNFQLAIQKNDILDLKLLLSSHDKFMKSSPDYINYDRAALHTPQLTAIQRIYGVNININNESPLRKPAPEIHLAYNKDV